MKFNPDCARAVLLCLEENLDLDKKLKYSTLKLRDLVCEDALREFDEKEIAYAVFKLVDAQYLEILKVDYLTIKSCTIVSITYLGHAYLDSVREEKIWTTTKEILSKVGAFSLDIIKSTAEGVATAAINKQLGLLP